MPDPCKSPLGRALAHAATRPTRPLDVDTVSEGAARRRRQRWIAGTAALLLVAAGVGLTATQLQGGPAGVVIGQPGDTSLQSLPSPTPPDDTPASTVPVPVPTDDAPSPVLEPAPSEDVPSPTPDPGASVSPAPSSEPAPEPSSEPQRQPRFTISTRVELIDASGPPPFTVDVTSPGVVVAGEPASHEVGFTGTDGTVHLDDPRFRGDVRDGDGRLCTGGVNCDGPTTSDYRSVRVDEGGRTPIAVALVTDELAAGTYVLDQPVAWAREQFQEMRNPDGGVTVRITYTVEEA